MFDSVVEAVFGYAGTQPGRLCLADDTHSVTYAGYADMIRRDAGALRALGVGAGDKVVVEACQSIEYLAVELALQILGAVFVPVEHNCAAEKIVSFARRCGAALILAVSDIGDAPARVLTHDAFEKLAAEATPFEPETFPARDAVSEILFSTGTTGREKGIVITHGNDIAIAENVIDGVEMPRDNVELILSPLNHSHGLRRYYANMINGSSVVLLGSAMNMARFMKDLDEYHVNAVDMVPSALTVVLRLSKGRLADYADALDYIQFGAAPMADADRLRICELLPRTRLFNFYGSTESGCIAIYDFNRPDAKKSCVGHPTRNAEIFMVDDERRPIASSATNPGLLSSRGGMNTPGYWQDEEETRKVLADGVIYSNDIAYFDEDGDIILMGRRGDVINVGGNKVSPDEIENAAMKIAGIADCGVIPVEDAAKGFVPKLFVQLKAGATFDPVAIRRELMRSLEPYKVPAAIVQIKKIPRSFNGKLLRRELKEIG